jgi:AAA domain
MIIFINGAFGAGKTTAAEGLAARLPDRLLFDPEEVGYFLRAVLRPIDNPDDFQDLSLWRTLPVQTAGLLRATYGRDLIMPMTIWHPPYFTEVIGGLRAIDPDVHHFCLIARSETLQGRLRGRGDVPGGFAWSHITRCVDAFQNPLFARQIPADDRTPGDLAATILAAIAR